MSEWTKPSKDLPALNPDLLPLAFRDYLEAVALAFQVPVEYPFLVAVGTLAAVTQGNISIQANQDYSECLSFYAAPVLKSGNRKSAVITEICKPANAYETERRKSESFEREQARAAYERQEEIVKAANSHKSKLTQEVFFLNCD